MKKVILLIIGIVCILLFSSSGCIQQQNTQQGIRVVATFYPLAFFTEEIGGDYVSVTQFIPDNTELHAWQPAVSDIVAANQADILVYNGASLDHWFKDDILPSIDQTGKLIVETTKNITLLNNSHEDEDEQGLYDPHTWVNPYIAQQQAEHIYNALVEKDPVHQEYYAQRWSQLQQRFITIDTAYQEQLTTKQKDIIIVTHAAFGYLADQYGFQQYGVIGLSADEQPSASTIASLVNIMVEHDINVVYVDPVYSDNYAQTLKSTIESETGKHVQILTLYIMSGVIDGMDYFDQLTKNLDNLKIGLQAF